MIDGPQSRVWDEAENRLHVQKAACHVDGLTEREGTLTTENLKRTPLHALHARLGAKLVPFAGFEMPVQYRDGIPAEHRAVREGVGLFDVSHMGEFEVTGPDRNAFVQQVTCNDVGALKPGQAQYSAILTEQGHICGRLRRLPVLGQAHAGRERGEHRRRLGAGRGPQARRQRPAARHLRRDRSAGGAGPRCARRCSRRSRPAGIGLVPYYHFIEGKVAGKECFISRTGYTGEDGFELYCRAGDLEALWYALVGQGRAVPCGLGARDTLRLEAGYPLYGNDIDTTTRPTKRGSAGS